MRKDAVLSDCETYRYSLVREWDGVLGRVLFILLNPSTADAASDDPTVRRCMNYARDWGYGGIEVVNLFAYRATDPRLLKSSSDPIGPENDSHLRRAVDDQENRLCLCAWGVGGGYRDRGEVVAESLVRGTRVQTLYALRLSRGGLPCHPLYLPSSLLPVVWKRP